MQEQGASPATSRGRGPDTSNNYGPFALMASSTLAGLTALVLSFAMARVADPSGRGEVAYALQWAYVMAPLLAVGLHRTLLRGERERTSLRGLMGLPVIVGLAFGIALLGLTRSTTLATSAIIAIGFAGLSLVRGSWVGSGRAMHYSLLAMAASLTYLLVGGILFASRTTNPSAWLTPYLIPAALVLSTGSIGIAKRDPLPKLAQLRSGFPQAVGSVAQIVATRFDRLILPMLVGYASLGVYVVPATALEAALWPVVAISDHKVSARTAPTTHKAEVREVLGSLWWVIAIVAGITGATWLLITRLLPPTYQSGIELLPPLALAAVMLSISTLASARILAGSRPGRAASIELGRMAAGLVIYPLMIVAWGLQGAAWASLVVYSLGAAIAVSVLLRTQPAGRRISANRRSRR